MRAAGLAALLCAVVALAWFFRWEVVMPAAPRNEYAPATVYLLNRWTGELRHVSPAGWTILEQDK
jgi:hypothetical protein